MPPPPVTSPRAPETEVISGASQIWVDPGWVNPAGISIRSRFPAAFRDKPCHAPVCDRHVHKPWRRQASQPESLPSRGPSVPPGGWSHPWRRGPVNLTPPSPVLRASVTPCPLQCQALRAQWGRTLGLKRGQACPREVPGRLSTPAWYSLHWGLQDLAGSLQKPWEARGGGPCDLYPLSGGGN